MRPLCSVFALLVSLLVLPSAASAQEGSSPPRYGVGFDAAFPVLRGDLLPGGLAIGLRGRGALPINADLSVAGDLGIGAHLFDGESTRYVLNPQTSLIVTLPGEGRNLRYILGGFGGFLPLSGGRGGATVHGGVGLAVPLDQTSLFVEFDPSLVLGQGDTGFVLMGRAGVIF